MRLISIYFFLQLLSGCTYDSVDVQYSDMAVITGHDGRYCLGCCGGLMIYLDGKTDQNFNEFNLIENPAHELGIDSTTVFPIAVNVRYIKLEKCSGLYIWISSMEIK